MFLSKSAFRVQFAVALMSLAASLPVLAFQAEPGGRKAASPADSITYLPANKASYEKLQKEVETTLRQDVLLAWFPKAIDNEHGGFYSDFSRDWQRMPSHGKFSVFQGRMTWISAQVVMRRPDLREQFLPYVSHGVDFLSNVMWDQKYGGFYWGLDDNGKVTPEFTDGKQMYGISFCIYGLAAAYKATHDPKALAKAQEAFRWIEEHAHDKVNGGYYEWLTREGEPMKAEPYASVVKLQSGFPIGYKSMNTHIHLLESLTELYGVWKDDTLKARVAELLEIVRDKVAVEPGVMNLFFTATWRPVPEHDSYGHDIETTYLMLEASEALGKSNDEETERVGRMMADHAIAYGWDEAHGGVYESGGYIGKPDDLRKEWWVEMETLNTLLLLHEKYGKETDTYWKHFQMQWQYITKYQVDHQYHGFYNMVRPDGTPQTPDKGVIWKAAYHDGRALLNVSERLQRLAAAASN